MEYTHQFTFSIVFMSIGYVLLQAAYIVHMYLLGYRLSYVVKTLLSHLFRQIEADLDSAHGRREVENLMSKQKALSQRICARCGEGFSLLFNRRLECIDCNLGVCRKCCVWINKSTKDKVTGWRCQACHSDR